MNNLLKNKNFFLLLQGNLVSRIGTHIFDLARLYWLTTLTESTLLTGLLLSLCSFAYPFIGLFSGVLADRISRKKILIISDLASGIAMIFLATITIIKVSISFKIAGIFLLSFFVSLSTTFFNTSIFSILPDIVKRDNLKKANSLYGSTMEFGQVIGQALGGVLYSIFGVTTLFLINGVSFFCSAFSEYFLKIPKPTSKPKVHDYDGNRFYNFIVQIKEAFAFLKKERQIGLITMYNVVRSAFFLPLFVLTPLLASQRSEQGSSLYGFLISSFAIGVIIGNLILTSDIFKKILESRSINILTILILPLMYIVFPLLNTSISLILVFAVIGICSGYITVFTTTLLQKKASTHIRGRIGGINIVLSNIFVPLSFFISGFLGDKFSHHLEMIFSFIGIVFFLISILFVIGSSTFQFLLREEMI